MAISGRLVRISKNGTTVVGARTDTVTINNEPIDITDKDENGWRTFMAAVGTKTVSAEVEGIIKDSTILSAVMAAGSTLIDDCEVEIQGIATLSGDFYLQSVSIGAEQADVTTFTATLESTGVISATYP